jgi:hypothetical protein
MSIVCLGELRSGGSGINSQQFRRRSYRKGDLSRSSDCCETRFEVVLDTHTANLEGYDLKQLAMLRDETGKTYEPVRIENKGSDHHREVIASFPKLASGATQFELVVKGIAGIKERTFRWDLK